MVLEIRIKNFFSIKEEVILDLRAANINSKKAKELRDNYFEVNQYKILKNIAIYGANASGKSSIVKAITFCNSMIFESHLHNADVVFNFIPFKFDGYDKKPSTYFIRFIDEDIEYEYSFTLTREKIVKEYLYYYPNGRRKKVFERDEEKGESKKDKYSFGTAISRPFDITESTSEKTLYLSRASQMDRLIPKKIFAFFKNNFILGNRRRIFDLENYFNRYKDIILLALKVADTDITEINISKRLLPLKSIKFNLSTEEAEFEEEEKENLEISSFHNIGTSVEFDFLKEESSGTIRMFGLLLMIIDVIKNNKILLIDELEVSLHPHIIEFILSLFNKSKKSQLIFTTHNTKILDFDKLRKDQIFFTNKKKDGATELYSLLQFNEFRDTMDVEKAYLNGRFGAIPYLDSITQIIDRIYDE